ncbi:hypothetical protein HN358_01015 [Candidatus Uhrbacteria bacterium]|jgi:uncharacterized membrane protein required for colicin V production|nr:hypothetical protein [Candidatus Uhrbacteria bacterium]MBT7717464.1 hypothetical protein [Candidatus Uhrbacteria bacterium]
MTFTLADLVLIAIAGLFIIAGLYHGFIRTLGSLVGLLGGMFLAIFAIQWLDTLWPISDYQVVQVIAFVLILAVASQLIAWLFELLDRAYKLLTIIPFVAGINKLLGGILGVLEAFVVLSGVIYYATNQLTDGWLKSAILDSQVVEWLSWTGGWIMWIVGLFI